MKKINLWLIPVWYILTLGLYPLIWLCLRRNEMVKKYKQSIPTWKWLVYPIVLFYVLLLAVFLLMMASAIHEAIAIFLLLTLVTFGSLALMGIYIWWYYHFSVAVEQVTKGRMSVLWSFIMYFLIGMIAMFFQQYYLNRAPAPGKLKAAKTVKPSKKFVKTAIITIVVAHMLYLVLVFALFFASFYFETKESSNKTQELSNNLLLEYDKCANEVDRKFPLVTTTNRAEYDAAFEKCEQIRQSQNNLVDQAQSL
jgi:hypothetical protein